MENIYETIIILKNNEEYKKELEKIKNYFNNCEIIKFEELGLKRLAYEINKNKQGFYISVEFKTESDEIREIERKYRIDNEILKFIVVRKD